jgi:hypothetical protein
MEAQVAEKQYRMEAVRQRGSGGQVGATMLKTLDFYGTWWRRAFAGL